MLIPIKYRIIYGKKNVFTCTVCEAQVRDRDCSNLGKCGLGAQKYFCHKVPCN